MKKKSKTPRGQYRKPKLYLNDLEEIVKIMEGGTKKVTIENGDCLFDSIEELRKNNGKIIHQLYIQSDSPYISVNIGDSVLFGNSLHVNSSFDEAIVIFHKIDTILRKSERKIFVDGTHWWWWLTTLIIFTTLNLLSVGDGGEYSLLKNLFMAAYSIWSIFLLWRISQKTEIYLEKRGETPPFFERQKDQIILIVIGAVLGGIIAIVGDRIISN